MTRNKKTPQSNRWATLLPTYCFAIFFAFMMASPVKAAAPDPYLLIAEVNALRVAKGLPEYRPNPILMGIAQAQAEHMSVNGVTHIGPGGTSPSQRALNAGYPLAGDLDFGGFISENIIAGRGKTEAQAVADWQGDEPHLLTMLSSNLTEIGAGAVAVDDYYYYVIDAALPKNTPLPTDTRFPTHTATATPTASRTRGPAPTDTLVVVLTVTPLEDGMLVHIVQPEETLWSIALAYSMTVDEIVSLNRLGQEPVIYIGQKLKLRLPFTPTATQPTATFTSAPTITPYPTATPSPTLSPTPSPVSAASAEESLQILGIILLAAVALAILLGGLLWRRK